MGLGVDFTTDNPYTPQFVFSQPTFSEKISETYISAEQPREEAPAWFPQPYGNGKRSQNPGKTPGKGTQALISLSSGPFNLGTASSWASL